MQITLGNPGGKLFLLSLLNEGSFQSTKTNFNKSCVKPRHKYIIYRNYL